MKLIFVFLFLLSTVAVTEAGMECFLCRLMVSVVEKKLESTEGQIDQNGDKLCDEITKDNQLLDPICRQMLDSFLNDIIDGLKHGDSADTICKKIKMCTATNN